MTALQPPNPDLPDPLHAYSSSPYSLLPRTFQPLKPINLSHSQPLHTLLKSLVLENPNNAVEQAKIILNNSSMAQKPESQPEDARKDRRRPALGRKPSRFSLKPNMSQPSLVEDMALNIEELKDPEKFFEAADKLENAQKEIRRQRGDVSVDSARDNSSTTARVRRPGILGKKLGYKHYSSAVADRRDSLVTSQKSSEVEMSGPTNIKEATHQLGASQERVVAGNECLDSVQESKAEAETRGGLLDELFDLDGDRRDSLLHERLPYKLYNLDEICSDSVCKTDFEVSLEHPTRPRKALSDINNVFTGVKSKTHLLGETFTHLLASPNPLKSPLASLAKRRALQADPPGNPFSFRGIELSPAKHPSNVNGTDMPVSPPNLDAIHDDSTDNTPGELGLSFSGKFQSVTIEEDKTERSNMDLDKPSKDDLACPLASMAEGPSDMNSPVDPRTNESGGCLQDKVQNEEIQLEAVVPADVPDLGYEGLSTGRLQKDNMDTTVRENDAEDRHHNINVLGREQNNEAQEELPTLSPDVKSKQKAPAPIGRKRRKVVHRKSLSDKSNPAVYENGTEDRHPATTVIDPQQNNEKHDEPPTPLSTVKSIRKAPAHNGRKGKGLVNKKSLGDNSDPAASKSHTEDDNPVIKAVIPEGNNKAQQQHPIVSANVETEKEPPARNRRKRKDLGHRKSLAGAGTVWQSGVRKSTRVKSRPLQYWKGERFLYGRIHESLVTVIGLKYESPAKGDGKCTFRVKSFVSDEYRELVDLEALH